MTEPTTDPALPADETEPEPVDASQFDETAADVQDEPNEADRIGEVHHFGDFDHFEANAGPLQPTVLDPSGVHRIVGPAVDPVWQPAPVAASDEDIARHTAFEARMEERRGRALAATQVPGEHTGGGEQHARRALEAERPQREEETDEQPAEAETQEA